MLMLQLEMCMIVIPKSSGAKETGIFEMCAEGCSDGDSKQPQI